MRTKAILALAAALSALLCFACGSGGIDDRGEIEKKVDNYIGPYLRMGSFSGSVLLAENGEVIVAKGYGLADREWGTPNAAATKFRLGSLTKQFTAACILLLQERGRLSVQDTLATYIPDYPRGDEITVHHLLTHTSGVPNFTGLPDYRDTMMLPTSLGSLIDRFKNRDLDFAPGERFSYSNSGYILLTYIIEKVSGQTFENFLRRNVLEPMGLGDTGYDRRRVILENRAAGYARTDDGDENSAYIDMSIPAGAGALYSTVVDLNSWIEQLTAGKLLAKESLAKMFAPFKGNYAYGWAVTERFNRKSYGHGGGINGFSTFIAHYPDDRLTVVVLSNVEGAPSGKIAADLAAICLGEHYGIPQVREEVSLPADSLAAYVGGYRLREGVEIQVTAEGDKLFVESPGSTRFRIYPQSETQFFAKVADVTFRFVRNGKGEVVELVVEQGGNETRAPRINPD